MFFGGLLITFLCTIIDILFNWFCSDFTVSMSKINISNQINLMCLSGFSGFLPKCKHMHVRWNGNSKWPLGCWSIFLRGPGNALPTCPEVWPRLHLNTAGIGSSTRTPIQCDESTHLNRCKKNIHHCKAKIWNRRLGCLHHLYERKYPWPWCIYGRFTVQISDIDFFIVSKWPSTKSPPPFSARQG